MTTFTLQELNLPTTADQAVEQVTKEQWMEYGMKHPISPRSLDYAKQQMGEVLPNPTLESVLKTIGEQLILLSTVISQAKAQPDTTPPEGENNASN